MLELTVQVVQKLTVVGDSANKDAYDNPVLISNTGTGTNGGHKTAEGPAIAFGLVRNNDATRQISGAIKGEAESDFGASWPTSLTFWTRRFDDLNEVARFNSQGRLGIGTSEPSTLIDAKSGESILSLSTVRQGTNYRNAAILFSTPRNNTSDGATHGGRGMITCLGNKDSAGGILWLNAATASLQPGSTDDELKANQCGLRLDSSGNIEHWHDDSLRFKITDDGRVGIQATTPEAFLHINNPVTAGVPSIYISAANVNANTSDIAMTANANIRSDQSINFITNTGGFFAFHTGGTDVKAGKVGATEIARIDKSGNATFSGTVTANGTILTRSSGTLDVGDRLEKVDAALQLLKTEAAAATTIAGLKIRHCKCLS